ncbi:hypothetical protein ACFWFZ_29050 [Streptomyces sp. NPDC060232]
MRTAPHRTGQDDTVSVTQTSVRKHGTLTLRTAHDEVITQPW